MAEKRSPEDTKSKIYLTALSRQHACKGPGQIRGESCPNASRDVIAGIAAGRMLRSQGQLAEQIHVNQAAISKMERRTDMYISMLRNFVKAMGGELEIVARFPDSSVAINQFHEINDLTRSR